MKKAPSKPPKIPKIIVTGTIIDISSFCCFISDTNFISEAFQSFHFYLFIDSQKAKVNVDMQQEKNTFQMAKVLEEICSYW